MSTTEHPGISLYLREVHGGEADLERELHAAGERHRTDHEVRHVTVDLARWSLQNRHALAGLAGRYGQTLSDDQDPHAPARPMAYLREKTAELLGRRPEPGLLLLHDLRTCTCSRPATASSGSPSVKPRKPSATRSSSHWSRPATAERCGRPSGATPRSRPSARRF